MSDPLAVTPAPGAPGWRPKFGLLLLILALVSPLLTPLVLGSDLPREGRVAVAGLLLFGLPMALMLAVVALIGQPAHGFITGLFGNRDPSPEPVGVLRYRTGLVLLLLAMLTSWIEPLVSPHWPALEARKVLVGAIADGLVLVALFVLGGLFWDKVHALFVHDARVVADSPAAASPAVTEAVQVGFRFYLGAVIFVAAFAAWLLVPAASAAGWDAKKIASLTGAIFVANKIGVLSAIAVMGKPGFNHLKRLLFGLFKKIGPPQQVHRDRYVLGLVLFLVPLLMTWVAPYAPTLFGTAGVYGFLESRALEILLLVGLFLLGGEFWDKLGALFKHRAKVEFGSAGLARGSHPAS
jgi:hypothetical protein